MLRIIFGPMREEANRGWRKLHKEELHNLYSLSSIVRVIKSRMMRWVELVIHMEEKKCNTILIGDSVGKRPFERPRCRQDNVKLYLGEIKWEGVDWISFGSG